MIQLRVKRVGGPKDGECDVCAREWSGDDGMPKHWCSTIAVDSFSVLLPGRFHPDGRLMTGGKLLYHVLIAVGYRAGRQGRAGTGYLLRTSEKADEQAWIEFFRALPGRPRHVICGGAKVIHNAVERTWGPRTQVFACAHHLKDLVKQHLHRAKLWNRRRLIFRYVTDDLFVDPWPTSPSARCSTSICATLVMPRRSPRS